jgi:hypothetical protein
MASSSKTSGPTLVPPLNFAMVEEGVYRSAYPTEANVPFLRHIGIRNVVLLSIEALPGPVKRSLSADVSGKPSAGHSTRGPIRVVGVADMRSWRVDGMNSGDDFSRRDIIRALDFAVDRQWHPILFVCPLGELQTSVLVGCMRQYQHWSLASIFSECELFTNVCRHLRSSLLFLIEAWDPVAFPISAVNIQYRNREMQLRNRTRAHQERRLHRCATGAATLDKTEKPNLSESAEDRAVDEEDEEEEEGEDEVKGTHSGTSDLADKSATAGVRPSSVTLSPQKTFSETSGTHSPPPAALKASNPEVALISTSGQRPPMMMRRAAEQRLRDQQQQQDPLQSSQRSQDLLRRDEGGDTASSNSGGVDPVLRSLNDGKEAGVLWAEWYLEALRVGEELKAHARRSPAASRSSMSTLFEETLPPPHVRYADVRNPPALDSRSKFTKESIVEEDDD